MRLNLNVCGFEFACATFTTTYSLIVTLISYLRMEKCVLKKSTFAFYERMSLTLTTALFTAFHLQTLVFCHSNATTAHKLTINCKPKLVTCI